MSFFSRLKHKLVVSALRHDNYSLYKNENAINASLYIDGKIAAFFAGFLNKKGDRIVIPRLAVDSSFKFFSPGYILLCESIKYLIDNSNVRNLDLCLGSEKYKTDMGGRKYETITVKVN